VDECGQTFNYRVTLANPRFQLRPIQHCDDPTAVSDYAAALQLASRFGHGLTPHAEHVGNVPLSHSEFTRTQPIKAEQQPAARHGPSLSIHLKDIFVIPECRAKTRR
jgi:hypothetical protein